MILRIRGFSREFSSALDMYNNNNKMGDVLIKIC